MKMSPRQRNKVSDSLSDTHFHKRLPDVPVTQRLKRLTHFSRDLTEITLMNKR